MIIRLENKQDINQIRNVIALAFRNHPHSQQTEHKIVDALRHAGALTLSLIAEDSRGEIVGHIAFSPVRINDVAGAYYGLGPVSVIPDKQNQGIGTVLIKDGMARLEVLGAELVVVMGESKYYRRFGFVTREDLYLKDVPPEYFMAFIYKNTPPKGEVFYHPAFFAT